MAQKLKGFPKEKLCEITVDILGLSNENAIKAIDLIARDPDTDSFNIITKIETGYSSDKVLHVGSFIIDPKLKQAIMENVSRRLITPKGFIKDLIENWFLSTDKYSIFVNGPEKGEEKELNNISFKIGSYIVSIFQVSGSPIIKLEGTPSSFFAYEEVKERVWNQYKSIPQYLKDFLNTLKIEFKSK